MRRKITNGVLTVVAVIVVIAQIWLKQIEDVLTRREAGRNKRKMVRAHLTDHVNCRCAPPPSIDEGARRAVAMAYRQVRQQENYRWN